ncbi:MAG: hypothetical protein H6926_03540 [Chromatiales bacterium]|nr:hypothetical protein [Chromatiales bacterium]
MHTLVGHSNTVTSVAVLDHNRIISASDDRTSASGQPATTACGAPCTPS